MSRKRTFEEFDDEATLQTSLNTQIYGVVTKLSPMKYGHSCTYYKRELTDSHSYVCLFRFDSSSREKLSVFYKEGVAMGNCQVKPSRSGHEFEVLVRKQTGIEKSHREFNSADACARSSSRAS